jgi:hypothetical protein
VKEGGECLPRQEKRNREDKRGNTGGDTTEGCKKEHEAGGYTAYAALIRKNL